MDVVSSKSNKDFVYFNDLAKQDGEQDRPANNTIKNLDSTKYFDPHAWKIQDFKIGFPLGAGKFGKVVLAKERKSGLIVALKVLSKRKMHEYNSILQMRREIEIQSNLRHKNIVQKSDRQTPR